MSGLTGAFTASISGLQAQSAAIGAISDNIANSQTIGYKRIETAFNSFITASNSRSHSPGGVDSRPVRTMSQQGPIASTGIATNLSIAGNGFFVVGVPGQEDLLYTRSGDFELDKSGRLVNSAGYSLRGWVVSGGAANQSRFEEIAVDASRMTIPAVPTSTIRYSANLPTSPDPDLDMTPGGTIQFPVSQVTFYDALGDAHTLELQWETVNDALGNRIPNQFALSFGSSVSVEGGPKIFTFNTSGPGAGGIASFEDTLPTIDADSDGVPETVAPPTTSGPVRIPLSITLPNGAVQTIVLDLGTIGAADRLTNFSGTEIELGGAEADGMPQGRFKSLEIDERGYITFTYDNGQKETCFQIPLARFANPNGLGLENGTAYSATMDAGLPNYFAPGTGDVRIIQASVEGSNVDIAREFTRMISTQRAYAANTQVLGVVKQMLEETANILR